MWYAPPWILISAHGIKLKLGSGITLNNRRQKRASFGSGGKSVIYRLDIIFNITHVVQVVVSKFNFCQRDICISVEGYPKRDTKLHTMSGSWKTAIADCFYVTLGRDVSRYWSLCLRKRVKFQTWWAKMFLRKFYQI